MIKSYSKKTNALTLAAVLLLGQGLVSESTVADEHGHGKGDAIPISSIPQDGNYLPTKRVQPKYPRSAFEQGIGGYVVVEFTVGKDGHVPADGIKVVSAEPKGVFDKVASEATVQFIYNPMMMEGKATAVSGVRYKFTFDIAE